MAKPDSGAKGDKKKATSTAGDNNDGDDKEITQVDTGDFVKVKQTLDEAIVVIIQEAGYRENYYWDNIRLLLMVVACAFAMVAQFYPIPFPESRVLLGVCCLAYFIASSVLQFIVTYIEKDTIMTTRPREPFTEDGLRIRTEFPQFKYDYTVMMQEVKDETALVKKTLKINDYFSKEGLFDEVKLKEDILKLLKQTESKLSKGAAGSSSSSKSD